MRMVYRDVQEPGLDSSWRSPVAVFRGTDSIAQSFAVAPAPSSNAPKDAGPSSPASGEPPIGEAGVTTSAGVVRPVGVVEASATFVCDPFVGVAGAAVGEAGADTAAEACAFGVLRCASIH